VSNFGIRKTSFTICVNDVLRWPSWHTDVQQNLFHNFDIATVTEQAKQKHVDHFRTYNELGSCGLCRSFQPEYQYAKYLATVKCFPMGGRLAIQMWLSWFTC
jgi:hypothetical protein